MVAFGKMNFQLFHNISYSWLILAVFLGFALISISVEQAYAADVNISIIDGSDIMTCSSTLDLCFTPEDAAVNVGDTVIWTNNDDVDHAINGIGNVFWDTGIIGPGESFSMVMTVSGNIGYAGTTHTWQVGTLTVTGSDTAQAVSIPSTADVATCVSTPDACYDPEFITVNLGDFVTWTNDASATHTATSGTQEDGPNGLWDSGFIFATNTYSVLMQTPGFQQYHCTIHTWQRGIVEVVEPPDTYDVSIPPGANQPICVDINNGCFDPVYLTVGLDDTVRWTNNQNTPHTTTSTGSLPWDSGAIPFTNQFSFQMTQTGVHPYACTIHPFAHGDIEVVNPGGISIPLGTTAGAPNCNPGTCYDPRFPSVGVGDIVTWINDDVTTHTTTSGTGTPSLVWDSGILDPGEGYSIVAPAAGTYDYYCKIHPWQTGVLDVVDLTSNPINPTIPKGSITVDLQTVATDLVAPVHLTNAGDDRRFIVDQPGEIRILTNAGTLLPTPFLDIKSDIITLGFFGTFDPFTDFDERGLLGLAFHPNYVNTGQPGEGKIYTFHTEALSGPADFTVSMTGTHDNQNVITEWEVDSGNSNLIDISTRREVMRVDEPQFNHQGGMLEFGPDGYLYIAFGDGGGANDNEDGHGTIGNSQDRSTILGSIVRIDPLLPADNPTSLDTISANLQYRIPTTNPFLLDSGALDEIYALGFRNPWRFSFDSMTGDLIVADVGQNLIEEIDIVQSGGNYGWFEKEGTFAFDSTTSPVSISFDLEGIVGDQIDPVIEYDHGEGISITGGFVYRGSAIPQLFGKYVFGDFSTSFTPAAGRIFYADLSTGQVEEFTLAGGDAPLATYVKSTGIDNDGELYFLVGTNLGPFEASGGVRFGEVVKLVPALCTINTAPDVDTIISSSCTVSSTVVAGGSVTVESPAVVTVTSTGILDIDFTTKNLTVDSGAGVLILSGGKIT